MIVVEGRRSGNNCRWEMSGVGGVIEEIVGEGVLRNQLYGRLNDINERC